MTENISSDTVESIDILGILEMIPHRYPLLLVDRLINIVPGKSATGIKNVTMNEPQFQGHFPGRPIMPGVMIVESMAQTAGVLVIKTLGADSQGRHVLFMSIDNARFRRPVTPGDTMHVEVTVKQRRGDVWRFSGVVKVDGKKVSEADFSAMIVD
ncbi:3-hydroxyacyl-ACP dehydratase FabZ [Sneathiella sp.]|uniref:3-hydroxyacyl-ACP dehydratase FabZ n=1 Tax=Sneathiella sp. TaxID=1964365 RepID=UPI0035662120